MELPRTLRGHLAITIAIDPAYFFAYLSGGQTAFNLRRFDEALDFYRCAHHLQPDDFLAARKIVQSLHALGRFDEALRPRQEAMRIYELGQDPMTQRLPGPVIEQAKFEENDVVVVEPAPVPPSDDPAHLVYRYMAHVFGADGQLRFSVVLESSPVLAEQGAEAGVAYYLPDGSVRLPGIYYRTVPSYEEFRPVMFEAIEQMARDR